MRDFHRRVAKQLYPDLEARNDFELVLLCSGQFDGTPDEFPAYSEKMMSKVLGPPSNRAKALKASTEWWQERLDAPVNVVGVRGIYNAMPPLLTQII